MVKARERLCALDMGNGITYIGVANFDDTSSQAVLDRESDFILKRVIAYQTQGIVLHLNEGRVSGFKGDRKDFLKRIYNNSYNLKSDQINLNLDNYAAFYLLDR